MKLVSFDLPSPLGSETRIGALLSPDRIVDLASAWRWRLIARDGLSKEGAARLSAALLPADMVAFIENGAMGRDAAEAALDYAAGADPIAADGAVLVHAAADLRLRAPVPKPPLIRDFMAFETHLKNIYPKLGREIPPQWYELPVYYKGNPAAVGGPDATVPMPNYATKMDYEFEFAAVIGKGGSDIAPERAMEHIYGYMIYNDLSAREIQQREMSVGLGPAKGKDFNQGHVFGPWLVTADEVPDPYALDMRAEINGQVWCEASSASMHWRFEQMIAHASRNETVRAGEIFGSGTVGNGSAMEKGEVLMPGDEIALSIAGLGRLVTRIGPTA